MDTNKTMIDILKEQSYKGSNERFNELKQTFLEMSCIKSEFDMEKLTTQKNGPFIAHDYHFLIRQYSLTLGELRRLTLDRERKLRRVTAYKEKYDKAVEEINEKFPGLDDNEKKKKYESITIVLKDEEQFLDIEIFELENQIDSLELEIANRGYRIDYYERLRLKLIELNGRTEPTNRQYQDEEPEYIKWFLEREFDHDMIAKATGLRLGVIDNIDLLEREPMMTPNFQRFLNKEDEATRQKYIEEFATKRLDRTSSSSDLKLLNKEDRQ